MTATGNATYSGNFTVAANVTGGLTSGTAITIINTAGGTSGRTITVTDDSARYTFTGENGTAGDVTITPTFVSSAATTTSNNSSVATVLDSIAGTSTGDMGTVQTALSTLSTAAALDAAFAQLDPINNGVTTQASFNTVNGAVGAVNSHLNEGSTGGAATGVATGDFWTDNGIWMKGFGNSTEQDNHKGANGYDATMWGILGGIDGRVADSMRLGFAGGYAATSVDNKTEAGGTDIDSYIGTVYVGYDDPSPWYGNMGFTFTWNGYEGSRPIAFGTLDRDAKSDYDGQAYTGFGEVGYVLTESGWDITPLASLNYTHLSIDSYTETDANSLDLHVDSQSYDKVQSGLGVKVAYPIQNASGKWVPEGHFKWLYDFVGDKASTTATFTGGGASFNTTGLDPEQSTFDLGAGITFYSKGNVSVTGVYDFEFGDDYSSHTGQGVVRYTF